MAPTYAGAIYYRDTAFGDDAASQCETAPSAFTIPAPKNEV